ncbi:MAG: MFS transporter [Clostridia bacterium]|nr:MFS transporter [Clostridia bacterium]
MQFKLLNFHNLVGNFATSLVGTFIPLMIYKQTGSIRLAVLFIFGQCLVRLLSNHIFKKLFNKYPQITLMIRIIPLVIYNICLIFLDRFMVWGIVIIIITYGMSLSLKNNAVGVILNYSSKNNTSKKLASTRVVESISAIVAAISGGLFIDWNQTWLIILSLSLYLISVIPLFIYYLCNKGSRGFNQDFSSNVAITYDKDPQLKQKRKSLVKKFLVQFFVFYALFCFMDHFTSLYSLYLFISAPTFAQAGYITAMFYVSYLVAILFLDWISKKIDLNSINFVCGIICAVPIALIPLIKNYIAIYSLIFVFGFTYSICSYFMMNSLMEKCKIVSANNKALVARQDGIILGQVAASLVVFIIGDIFPIFFVMAGMLIVYSIYSFIVEKRLRKNLVDYIENNEIE